MSEEEHLVENLLDYITRYGWSVEKMPDSLKEYGSHKVDNETFRWLVIMAKYVVYENEVWNS